MTQGASTTPTNFSDPDKMWRANWMGWYSAHPVADGWHKPVSSGGPATGPTTTLKVTFNSEEAGYANSMGWYNARTGQAGILFQDLNDDGPRAGVQAGDSRTFTVLQSDVDAGNVGFFLIPNGANELSKSLLSSQMRFEIGSNGNGRIVIDRDYGHDVVLNGGDVLFSNQTYNKGDYDYVSGKVGTDGQTRSQKLGTQSDGPDGILGTMAWDDQAVQQCGQGTDRDFNDVVFTVSKEGSSNPPPPPPPNSAPTDISLSNASINENVAGGVVGTLSTVDPNAGDTHSYTVSDSRFEVANGQLKLKAGVSLDFETQSSIALKITTTDQGGLSYSENFTIAVKDVNEAPSNSAPTDISLSNVSINENAAGGAIGTLSTVDPNAGDTHSYTVSDSRFEVVNGQLKLKAGTSLDFESQSSIELKITTTDQGGLGFSENFTITVKDVNEAPSDISLSNLTVDENASGAVIGKLSTTDPDVGNTHSYTVSDNRFEVVNGQLKLKAGVSLDFETQSSVALKITTTDQGGLGFSENFTIAVKDVNETPSNSAPTDINLSNASINENVAGGAIGTLSTVDPNAGDTHTYTVSDNRFEVVNGQLKLKSGIGLDHETEGSVALKITTADQGGLSFSEDFTITVKDVNEGPGSIVDKNSASDTILETAAIGTVVGITASSTDPDAGDSVTYSLSNNAGGLFAINSTTGVVTVAGGLDFETASQYTITVRATDGSGRFSETDFAIKVGDVTQHTVDGYISGATVFADANGNGIRDAGEAFVTTGAFGDFDINAKGAPLVMVGGFDIATGLPFHGKLTAQAGSTAITPLTTLVVELGKAGVPNPTATLAGALGLTGVSDFGQLDPIATAATSINAFARSSQVLNTVTMVASLIAGGHDTVGLEGATAAAFAMLAAQAADGVLNLGDTTTLAQLINGTASYLGLSALDGQLVASAAVVIAASNSAVDAIVAAGGTTDDLLTHISAASIVAQNDASMALRVAAVDGDTEVLMDAFTGTGLTNQIDFAVSGVGNVNGTGTVGLDGDDTIVGTSTRDTIAGGSGNDTLSGAGGNDLLYGGAGDDTLNGGSNEDRLTGGAGNDMLNGGLGADTDTYLHSGTTADGDDTLSTGDDGFDHVVFTTTDLSDLNYRRDGNDLLVGAHHSGGTEFDGSIRVVNHYAGSSIAFVEIDTSHNLTYGTTPDVAQFFFTTDLANGLNNTDAAEILLGGNGNDVINGNGGYYDAVFGGGGDDTISGGDDGFDSLHGGAGNDQIFGNDGDNVLAGDGGNDLLVGGSGIDTFLFDLNQAGADTLVAFDKANDLLSFTGLVDKDSNGSINLNDLLAIVSGVHDFGQGGNVVVDFTTGASLTFQGAGTAGGSIHSLASLVANPSTQIQIA